MKAVGPGTKPQTAWAQKEIARAALLWAEGLTIPEIAVALKRNEPGVRHMIRRNREKFPRRNIPWGTRGPVELKVHITPFAQKTIDFHAAKAKVSVNRLVQLLILDAVTSEKTMLRVQETAERRATV